MCCAATAGSHELPAELLGGCADKERELEVQLKLKDAQRCGPSPALLLPCCMCRAASQHAHHHQGRSLASCCTISAS